MKIVLRASANYVSAKRQWLQAARELQQRVLPLYSQPNDVDSQLSSLDEAHETRMRIENDVLETKKFLEILYEQKVPLPSIDLRSFFLTLLTACRLTVPVSR